MKKILILALFSAILNANWNLYPTYPAYLQKQKDIINNFFFRAKTNEKIVALTFDDGPNKHTAKIMQVLQEQRAPATFFLIAKNLKNRYDNLYTNPLFSVGMHTFSHKNFDKLNKNEIAQDFKVAIDLFKKHNLSHKLFRSAYGVVNKNLAKSLQDNNVQDILWSNDTRDWSKKLKNYKAVVNNLTNGDIILMHDHATSPKELRELIKAIRFKGFKIVSLERLLQYKSDYPVK